MSRITVERSHSLGLAVAREKAEALAQRLASEYDVKYRWSGDTLEFKRSGADGTIAVGDDSVRVELKLGLPGSHFDCGMLLLLLRRPVDAVIV